jgi:anti-sigma B factor antagonist
MESPGLSAAAAARNGSGNGTGLIRREEQCLWSDEGVEGQAMPVPMTTRSFADAVIVEVSGRIVLGEESANFRHFVKDLLGECKQIVLDLGKVTHIDSTGLGVLVGLLTSARKAGGGMKLANLNPRLVDVLGVTKLMTIFETFDRPEDAAQSFNAAAGEVKAAEWSN